MNAALERRLTKLEEQRTDALTIRVVYGDVDWPEIEAVFVTAKDDPDNQTGAEIRTTILLP